MIEINSIADIELLQESVDLECKLAIGRDGRGTLPNDIWPTYSAFANAQGGMIILGLRERNGQFDLMGILDSSKIRTELFNGLNNRQKVSVNLLSDTSVREVVLDGKTILVIDVPRATRMQRPVYLTENPLAGHTYRRLNDGDRALPDDEVKRMLAEQMNDSRDNGILADYDIVDLDSETLRKYRQVFNNRDPGHVWNALDDREFLRQIGGWRRNRENDESGLTLAGLLMFGQMVAIQEVLPNYMLDYQERAEARTNNRWIDRLTLDGKWSGNLYDFYLKVYLKLTSDLKVPFQLEGGVRREETPVHEALREALANVLVHADFSDRASVLVVKRPDMFGFRNPGLMRIAVEIALKGGESDCRNRTLHKMFRFVGVGEQAGTGIAKILHGWQSQHWSPPRLYDTAEPYNQTLIELRMTDLFPSAVMAGLKSRFGALFEVTSPVERVALALAASEGTVNHARLKSVTSEHPVDLSRSLHHLVQVGMLESTGGRGAVYHLPGEAIPTPEEIFGTSVATVTSISTSSISSSSNLESSSSNLESSSSSLESSSSSLESSSSNLESSSSNLTERRNAEGCLLSDQLSLPIIDDLDGLSMSLRQRLETLAAEPRSKRKISRESMIEVVLELCAEHFVTLRCLAALVNRTPETLRNQYLTGLVQDRKLSLAFPKTPTHERQAYCTSSALSE